MNTSVTLNKTGVRQLLNFCKNNNLPDWFFAKDQGAYFGATVEDDAGFRSSIHYAKGCNPSTNDDWYDYCHHRFGGDDFGELFPISILEVCARENAGLKIKFAGDDIQLYSITYRSRS